MKFTVGIVTYERPTYLQNTLESLTSQHRSIDELIIIDDSSTNKSEQVVSEFIEQLNEIGSTVIYHHRSASPNDGTGMTDARNVVLDQSSGDVICFIDDDVICPPGWLAAYEDAYEEFPDAAVIGGPGFDVTHPDDDIDILETNENQNKLNKYGECQFNEIHWAPPAPVRTHHVRGVNMSFPRHFLEDIGGFNPVYKGPAFFEETDVMARLWKRDEKIIYHPDVALYHIVEDEGEGVKKLQNYKDREVWYWAARNGIVFRYQVFPERFLMGLIRILFYTKAWPGPIWKEIGAYALTRNQRHIHALNGYIDGIGQVFGLK